jgi:hypothetical protein
MKLSTDDSSVNTQIEGIVGSVNKQIEGIVERARRGSRLDHEIACELAMEMLEVGKTAPLSLRDYISRVLRDGPPPGKPGVSPQKHFSRNLAIEEAVTLVHSLYGFKLTRNPATRSKPNAPESACSIVARALAALGLHISEDGVKEAYDQAQKVFKSNS